ncbi:hypothetical protein AeRB84_021532 [Aphanomyces euteiches]|nr:hypothetical protein AeRB84_021532 [Aphanomyces euteiches]
MGIAIRDESGVWTVRNDPPSGADFASIFALRLGSHTKQIESDVNMHDWLVSVRHQRVTLSIYKYGNEIGTKQQLAEFNSQCVAPSNCDRSGAPSEDTIQDYIEKLRTQWAATWEADSHIWRIWATHVVKPPMLAWESRVRQDPPPHVFSRLRPATSSHAARLERICQNNRTILDVIDGALLELNQLKLAMEQTKSTMNVVIRRLELFEQSLVAKREIIVSQDHEFAPIPANELPIPLLSDNNNDIDHDYGLEDID